MDERFTCTGEEFYTTESCEDLVGAIHNCEDSLKYVYSSHSSALDNEGAKFFEDKELLEEYFHIRNACLEFVQSYDYYSLVHAKQFPKEHEEFSKELIKRTNDYTTLLETSYTKVMKYQEDEE